MKKFLLKASVFTLLFLGFSSVFAQNSNYSYYDAFAPNFYTKNASETRSASGKPGAKYWQNKADYKLTASLNEATNEIKGSVNLTYTNNSPDELSYIWMYLDQNLFAKDSRGNAVVPVSGSRNGAKGEEFDGGHKISMLTINGKASKYEIVDTRMKVYLDKPLKANGGKLKIAINFSFISPEYGSDRMGYLPTKNGTIYTIAQWYPKMAVYDDVRGWNTQPYLGAGEFYCEYGDFEMALTVPANHFVVCSGEITNASEVMSKEEQNRWNKAKESESTVMIRSLEDVKRASKTSATKTWKFKMTNSRDVAWASSASFIIDGARINLPSGKKSMALSAYPEESEGQKAWSRSTEYTKGSIEGYSKRWLEYPYPAAINVAGNEGGMEYPGIVFCKYSSKGSSLWGVTDHEFGHAWFPMIVGSNERQFAWMDEGFNTFINGVSAEDFNAGEYQDKKFNMHLMAEMMTKPSLEPVYTAPDGMKERNLGLLAYMKPGTALAILREHVLGIDRFDDAFKTYIKNWAFKHPTPDDFFRTMENASGEDLGWFWRGWILNNWRLDQAVTDVKYVKNNPANGAIITIDNLEKMAMPVVLEVETVSGVKTRVNLPVEIWQRNTSWSFSFDSTEELKTIVVDPDNVLPDFNDANNKWKTEGFVPPAPGKLSAYTGSFSSKQIPITVEFVEEDDQLILNASGQQPLPLEDMGNNVFGFEEAGLEVKFSEDKKSFNLSFNGQSFDFTRN
ncbi:M1 family metallopeptidase [Flavobacterium sp. N2270]|uniref:M1 family metallopeptidase n=1 Tax=Flavobacterium sp. N2270 TaxID=2986831 RepID=UPI002224B023|nr:M1 family metallopeptidase [Flavobacterium sp. N2270]